MDVTFPLEKVTTFLKAAYKTSNVVRYHFESISEEELPDEVAELLPIDTGRIIWEILLFLFSR